MFKKFLSLILICAMVLSIGVSSAYAADISTEKVTIEQATIILDNNEKRVAKYDNVVATYDKKNNTMYVDDGTNSFSYSLATQKDDSMGIQANRVIKSESVALHAYEWVKTDSGKYYWGVDIPSYDINPKNWCGWISVWDDSSEEGQLGEEFADYIDAAQDDEHTIATYGGATLVAAVVGLATKNPVWSSSAFKAICTAAGIVVTYGLLDAGSSYFNNLDNARENYFAIREIIG